MALIPYTLAHTTLGEKHVGDLVNLEIDLIGKYVQKYLQQIFGEGGRSSPPSGLTEARLRELGY